MIWRERKIQNGHPGRPEQARVIEGSPGGLRRNGCRKGSGPEQARASELMYQLPLFYPRRIPLDPKNQL